MSVTMLNTRDTAREIREAYQSGDTDRIEQAYLHQSNAIANEVAQRLQGDLELFQSNTDQSILAQRGYRTLTRQESAWYNKVISAMRSANPKQAFAEIIGSDNEDDLMPSTIIEDVYRRLTEEHPLLNLISTQQVKYLTKWILNKHNAQQAAWGVITAAVEKEISSSFDVVDIKQNKLSCYAILELGMVDLGPVFLDNYVRTCLYEAMSCALEAAVVCGTGVNQPAGMDRDLSADSYNTSTGWAQKSTIAVTDFTPATYGSLLANLATDEDGKKRSFDKVALVCNLSDYLTKVMPATTVLNSAGAYVNNLFPFPTDVIVSNYVSDGKAILGLPEEYHLFMGSASRSGVITYDDSYHFLEDQRVFKIIQYADGRAEDNTSFMLLDISALESAYITVKSADVTTA